MKERLSSYEELIKERESVVYKNITIYYLPSDAEVIPVTKKVLNRAIRLNENLKITPENNQPCEVIIFNDKEEIKSFSKMGETIGVYFEDRKLLGVLHETVVGKFNRWGYSKNVMHEYTHHLFTEKRKELGIPSGEIPLWFSEGVAEYIGYDETEIDVKISDIYAPFAPLNELITGEQWNRYRTDFNYSVYLQSYVVVKYIVQEYGVDSINKILLETKSTGDFQKALEKTTGISIETLEQRVKDKK